MDFKYISFIEHAAIQQALEQMRKSKRVSGLYESEKKKVIQKLSNFIGATGDDQLDRDIFGLKYWRFINRRNHPSFDEVETAIANSLTFRHREQIVETLKNIHEST